MIRKFIISLLVLGGCIAQGADDYPIQVWWDYPDTMVWGEQAWLTCYVKNYSDKHYCGIYRDWDFDHNCTGWPGAPPHISMSHFENIPPLYLDNGQVDIPPGASGPLWRRLMTFDGCYGDRHYWCNNSGASGYGSSHTEFAYGNNCWTNRDETNFAGASINLTDGTPDMEWIFDLPPDGTEYHVGDVFEYDVLGIDCVDRSQTNEFHYAYCQPLTTPCGPNAVVRLDQDLDYMQMMFDSVVTELGFSEGVSPYKSYYYHGCDPWDNLGRYPCEHVSMGYGYTQYNKDTPRFQTPVYVDWPTVRFICQKPGFFSFSWNTYNKYSIEHKTEAPWDPNEITDVRRDKYRRGTDLPARGYYVLPDEAALPGDMNCDGTVSVQDISAFVTFLTDREAWYHEHYHEADQWLNGDCNGDGMADIKDLSSFIYLMAGVE